MTLEDGMDYRSNKAVDSFISEFLPPDERQYLAAWEREVEIFGDSIDLPADEWAIVFESNLPQEEVMVQLRALRASKGVNDRTFAQRLTAAGRIHAHALGVRLD
jgi:hypothetical protein